MNSTGNDIVIASGGVVKGLPGREPGWFGGYGVIFSTAKDPDLQSEYFTPRTDLDLYDGQRIRTYYRHGIDPIVGRTKITQASFHRHEKGVWFEGKLDLNNPLHKRIDSLIQKGKLGFSTGTMGHLTHREQRGNAKEILEWPVGELSFSPTPCEVRARVTTLKSLFREEYESFMDFSAADLDEWERAQAEISDKYMEDVRKVRPDYVSKNYYEQRAAEAYARTLMIGHELRMMELQRMGY